MCKNTNKMIHGIAQNLVEKALKYSYLRYKLENKHTSNKYLKTTNRFTATFISGRTRNCSISDGKLLPDIGLQLTLAMLSELSIVTGSYGITLPLSVALD